MKIIIFIKSLWAGSVPNLYIHYPSFSRNSLSPMALFIFSILSLYSLYQHFHSSGHLGLKHISIQLIDRDIGERELREKETQWPGQKSTSFCPRRIDTTAKTYFLRPETRHRPQRSSLYNASLSPVRDQRFTHLAKMIPN